MAKPRQLENVDPPINAVLVPTNNPDMMLDTETGELIPKTEEVPIATRTAPFWKTPWNHDTNAESRRCGLTCRDESKTQQNQLADADINNILRKFMNTGQLPTTNASPQFLELEEEFDLQSKMVTAWEVEQAWRNLPAAARNILRDPRTMVEYVDHCLETGDIDPLRELGLANARPAEPPQAAVQPPNPTPAPPGDVATPSPAHGAPESP